jgi:hypothetical protein
MYKIGWIGMALIVMSCGGSSSPNSSGPTPPTTELCSGFEACGGDVLGDWNRESICLENSTNQGAEDCPEMGWTKTYKPDSVVSFKENGIFSSVGKMTTSETITFPLSCFEVGCGFIEASLSATKPGFTCTETSETCTCSLTETVEQSSSGTWSVEGDLITTHLDGDEDPHSGEYCVDGDVLRIRDIAEDPSDPNVMSVMRRIE